MDWNNKQSRSSVEMSNPNSRPAIATVVENMENYKTIIIGFPIWWYVAPTIINTFLESYDFSQKNIALFATSGGSGLGKTEKIVKPLVSSSARWLTGERLRDRSDAIKWIENLCL